MAFTVKASDIDKGIRIEITSENQQEAERIRADKTWYERIVREHEAGSEHARHHTEHHGKGHEHGHP